MTQESEMAQKGDVPAAAQQMIQEGAPQQAPKEENMALLLLKMLLKHPSMLIKLRRMDPDEERYVAPPRPYELPVYRKGMKYSTSNEPYLRPTRWCNPRQHQVIALAHELGAYELSDWDFAEAAYWWMKTNMWWEMTGFDDASATIRRGSGMCFHFINSYIALCRCAGIKARYKGYKMKFRGPEMEYFAGADPGMKGVWEAAGGVIPEAEAEVYIDGKWVTAYLAQTLYLTATYGVPVIDFGESSIGIYFDALPGSINRFESIPLGLGLSLKLTNVIAPAAMGRLNILMSKVQKTGKQELEDAGGLQEYNKAAKRRREIYSADEILDQAVLKHIDKIIIKKKPQQP